MARWSKSYPGNPNTFVSGTKGTLLLDTSTPAIWINVDSASGWQLLSAGAAGGTAVGSIVMANSTPASTVNLTTEGTLDWLGTDYSNSVPGAWAQSSPPHSKISGGWLLHTFEGIAGTGGASTPTNTTLTGVTFSATGADDKIGGGLPTNTYTVLFATTPTPNNYGYKCRVPARTSQQVLRLYLSLYACTVTVTSQLTLSGVTVTDTITVGASQTNKVETITFKGQPGDELAVKVLVTTNSGSASVSCAAISLGIV